MANEIFISYRRSDEPRARLFYNLLKERGVEAWYDAKIEAGEDWRTSTANALDAAPIFVLLLSRTASESGDIAKELAAATHKRKLVVPVRLDDMQLEGVFLYELASRNWIDAFKDTEKKLADLADKLAALVKSDLSPEAAAALEMNVAHIAAARSAKSKGAFPRLMRNGGSVALLTAGAVALVAAVGGGAWFLSNSSSAPPKAWTNATAASAATATPTGAATATAAAASQSAKPKLGLAASLTQMAATAKASGRSDAEVASLTDAAAKLNALTNKATAGGDAAALAQAKTEMNDIALAAVRTEIAALAADPVVTTVRSDFKVVGNEQKASGVKMDPAVAKALASSDDAQAAIKAASDAVAGTDGAAALEAAISAQQSFNVLVSLQPTANDAFLKAKRLSYASSSAAARTTAGQIAQLASARKPNVFASSDRKEAYKSLVAIDASARARMAEVDVVAASVATADRKAVTKYAAQAATVKTELDSALAKARAAATRLAAT